MLYYLFQWLDKYDFPGAGMFGYTSFRALMAIILALLISAIWGDKFIDLLKRKQITETQRDAKIDPFGVNKVGVPSMGGVIIIFAILIPCLLLGKLENIYMILMLITTVWLGSLGFADDYIKMKISKDGLRPIYKLAGQTLLGLFVGLTLWLSPDAVIRENVTMQQKGNMEVVIHKSEKVKSTSTTIPFVKNNNLSYSEIMGFCGKYKYAAGWILFVIMTTFVVVAVSNGSNLNDGMDGMTAGNSAIIGVALGILAYVSSHIEFASYLNIMYIPESEELVIFICAFIGALIGFLWYNAYPAQIFMGDTGIDEWRNAGFYHATNVQSQARALKIPAWDLQLHIALKVNFRHLFRYRSGRFHATRTDKARYARRCDHCRTSDTKGFGNRAIADITSGIFRLVARKHRSYHLLRRASKPLAR